MSQVVIDMSRFSRGETDTPIQDIEQEYSGVDYVKCNVPNQSVVITHSDWRSIYHKLIQAIHTEISAPYESYPEHRGQILRDIEVIQK